MEIPEWIKKLSDKKLKDHAISLYEAIYIAECYGSKDIVELDLLCAELQNRGYSITERMQIKRV